MDKMPLTNEFPKEYNPDDLKKYLEGAAVVAGAVYPWIGVCVGLFNMIAQHNQAVFFEELKVRFDELEDEVRKLKMNSITSDAGQELLKFSLIKTKDCYHDAQISRMIDIIMVALDNEKISYKDANCLIDIVCNLTVKEAEFFVWLAKGIVDMYNNYNDKPHFFDRFEWTEDRIELVARKTDFYDSYIALFNRLEAKGLVNHVMEIISKPKIYNNRQVGNTIETKSHFQLTYFGILYVKLINNMLETAEF